MPMANRAYLIITKTLYGPVTLHENNVNAEYTPLEVIITEYNNHNILTTKLSTKGEYDLVPSMGVTLLSFTCA